MFFPNAFFFAILAQEKKKILETNPQYCLNTAVLFPVAFSLGYNGYIKRKNQTKLLRSQKGV